MRKLRIIEHISLDGIIQAPGGRTEDGDYPYGGWAMPHSDPVGEAAIVAAHGNIFDLLPAQRAIANRLLRHCEGAGRRQLQARLKKAVKAIDSTKRR
jgi:hypothetical protein